MLWFKHPDALKPNLSLLSYLALAYPLALYGLSSPAGFAPSLLLMVNVLVLSAYPAARLPAQQCVCVHRRQ